MSQSDLTVSDVPPNALPSDRVGARSYAPWLGLLALCLFLFFFRLGSISLFDLDEALYVTCARQMVLSGDNVTPELNTRPLQNPQQTTAPFFEKPIMVYWCAAAAMRLFGISEGAARLPVALAALLTTFAVALVGARWFGARAGLLAGVVYATAPMTLADARQMTTDGLLVLWFTGALFAFWRMYYGQQAPARADLATRWLAPALFWTMCACAVLTKGAVGLLIPALVIGAFLIIDRLDLRLGGRRLLFRFRWNRLAVWRPALRALRPLLGLALLIALAAPWHLLIWKAGGISAEGRTFYQEYIIRQHIGRFRGGDTVHNAPLPTYFAYFLLGFFPWACFAPAAFRRGKNDPTEPETADPHRFLLVWFWTIFTFFSLGAAKLPTYIVPAYPAAALLIGRWLDNALAARGSERALRRGALGALSVAGLLIVAAALTPRFTPRDAPVPPAVVLAILHLTALLAIGCLLAWFCFQKGEAEAPWRKAGVVALVGTMIAILGVGVTEGYAAAEQYVLFPYQEIARAARPDAQAGMPVVFYHIVPRRPSMLFYAQDYSPLERKETPLLPFLRGCLNTAHPDADVLTTRTTLEKDLQTEIHAAPDATLQILREEKGWVLLRVHLGR